MESIACASRRRAIDSGGEQVADEESKRGSYAEKRGPQRREMKGLEAWLCTSNESHGCGVEEDDCQSRQGSHNSGCVIGGICCMG